MCGRLFELLRRLLDFYLVPANAGVSVVQTVEPQPRQSDPPAERLQDLPFGMELAEVWRRQYPGLSDEEIEQWLRQV